MKLVAGAVQRNQDRRQPPAPAQREAAQRPAGRVLGRVQQLVVVPELGFGKGRSGDRGEREHQRRPREERPPAFYIFHLPKSSSERFSRKSENLFLLWPLVPLPLPFSTMR